MERRIILTGDRAIRRARLAHAYDTAAEALEAARSVYPTAILDVSWTLTVDGREVGALASSRVVTDLRGRSLSGMAWGSRLSTAGRT
jgi:hypothetical protein